MPKSKAATKSDALLGKVSREIGMLGILTQLLIDEVRTAKGKPRMDWPAFWKETLKGKP